MQNFFKETIEKDPLSLISIYAKRHASPEKTQLEKVHSRVQKHKQHKVESSDSIKEDIYSENFDEEKPSKSSEIEEDIIVSKDLYSHSSEFDKKKNVFPYKKHEDSIHESI